MAARMAVLMVDEMAAHLDALLAELTAVCWVEKTGGKVAQKAVESVAKMAERSVAC